MRIIIVLKEFFLFDETFVAHLCGPATRHEWRWRILTGSRYVVQRTAAHLTMFQAQLKQRLFNFRFWLACSASGSAKTTWIEDPRSLIQHRLNQTRDLYRIWSSALIFRQQSTIVRIWSLLGMQVYEASHSKGLNLSLSKACVLSIHRFMLCSKRRYILSEKWLWTYRMSATYIVNPP